MINPGPKKRDSMMISLDFIISTSLWMFLEFNGLLFDGNIMGQSQQ